MQNRITFKIINILLVVFLISIYFNSTKAINGALRGIYIWHSSLLPALLAPLILLSIILKISNNSKKYFIILLSSFAGIPTSSKIISNMFYSNQLTPLKYKTFLILTGNPSLSFMSAYIFLLTNKKQDIPHFLSFYPFFIVTLSSIIISLFFYINNSKKLLTTESCTTSIINTIPLSDDSLDNIILSSITTVLKILGYVVIFSTLSELLSCFGDYNFIVLIRSYLEISCGILLVIDNFSSQIIYYSLICSLCAFGGICGIMQMMCVIPNKNLDILTFLLKYKMLNAILAFSISYIIGSLIF